MTVPVSVFVACPAYGEHITTPTVWALMHLALDLPRRGIDVKFSTYSYHDIVRIRNLMLTYWYDRMPDTSHILFVDADNKFEPYIVVRMLQKNAECVGLVYPKKAASEGFVGAFLTDERPGDDGFLKVRGLGGGCLLIRRDCIDRLLQADLSLSDTREPDEVMHGDLIKQMELSRVITAFDRTTTEIGGKMRELGEDLSFCERVRNAGMTVWGNVSDVNSHVGWQEFQGAMYPRELAGTDSVVGAAT